MVAALYPVERNRDRCGRYPNYRTVLNLDGIDFLITLREITRFERLNNISVNVFTFKERNDKRIYPLRLTDSKRDVHINLLYLPALRRDANESFCMDKESIAIGGESNKQTRRKEVYM